MTIEDDEDRLLRSVALQNAESIRIASQRAEQQAEATLRQQAQLLNLTHDAILVRDMNGTIKYWSRGAEELYGWPAEQAVGRVIQDMLKAVLPAPLDQIERELVRAGRWEGEIVDTKKDGSQIVVVSRWFLQQDDQGKTVAVLETNHDITERKRAEALLAGEKRILEMVAKGEPLAQMLDSLCRLVEEQASGVLASILLVDGDHLRHGAAPSLPKAYTDAIEEVGIGPSLGSCGTAAYRGEQVIVQDIATDPLWADYRRLALPYSLRACWSTPVFSSQGKVIATFAMYYREPRSPSRRDQEIIEQITDLAGVAIERKLTQEALWRSEAYLAEAQRLSHTGSWAFNHRGNVYWSKETCRIWGFDPQDAPPSREAVLQRIHPEDRDRVLQSAQDGLREKRDYADEFRIVLPDGTVRQVHGVSHPVFNSKGELVEVVGTHVDVTERKRAEQERERLRQLEADLAHINRLSMMGELAASLAHEIKQPIAAAVTNAKTSLRWLQREPPDIAEARDAASRMVTDVNRAAGIIDRLRCFYAKGSQPRELLDVNEIIQEMIVLLHNEASRYSIPIHNELARDLPKVMADRVQLQQVFMNLMLNGIEAMKDTGGKLTIKSSQTEDGQLLISISDAGVGLPTEKLDQIFSAFFTTKPQGTGMGLAITRSIIEAHGGRVWAAANPDRGATFHFTLPTEAKVVVPPTGT